MVTYKLHEVRVSFSAPPLRALDQQSLDIKKKKEFEANFQWMKYALLFTDKKMDWYCYVILLYPWGAKQKGGQMIYASDSLGNIDENQEISITVDSVEKVFSKILREPDLNPQTQTVYLNGFRQHEKKYSSEQFVQEYIDSGRYVVLSKNRKLIDPFGNLIGKVGQPKPEEPSKDSLPPPVDQPSEESAKKAANRAAVRLAKEEYFSGGFDIMKKLVKKQRKEQKKDQ